MAEILIMAGVVESSTLRNLRDLALKLGEHGYSFRVICLDVVGPVPEGLATHEHPGLGHRWRCDWSVRRLFPSGIQRPDLIHVLGTDMARAGLATADQWRIPYLLTIDQFLAPGSRLSLSYPWARGIIATSQDLAFDLVKEFGMTMERVLVIPTGISLPDLVTPPIRDSSVAVVGTSGDLVSGGGLPTYLQAARLLLDQGLDIEFVVDGQGRDEDSLRRLASRMGVSDRVTFADDLDIGPAFWNVLDVFCRISLVPDTGPTLGEALSYGVPAIASDVPGLREWIRPGETGLLVPPDDPVRLAEAIQSLVENRPWAMRLGHEARGWIARHHAPEREAEALSAAYRKVLSDPAPRRSPEAWFQRQPAIQAD